MGRVVVMFPDYVGQAIGEDGGLFVSRVKKAFHGAIMVPILNALPHSDLEKIAKKHTSPGFCEPVVAEAKGLLGTLIAGYTAVLEKYPGALTVVRLDTAEHPPEAIPALVELANDSKGMVIGDLSFTEDTLSRGSVDEFAHLDIFPELYRQTTNGQISISCAHGFQAFAPGVLLPVLTEAQKIVRLVEEKTKVNVQWGFDGAMVLGAVRAGVPVRIKNIQAETLRDREPAKVAKQFSQALTVCRAFHDLQDV